MSEQIKLAPSAVTDSAVLAQCVEAMNKWSQKLPFGPTKALGTDTSLVSAKMYHTYGLSIDTDYAHREFVLEKGGKPMSNPKDIKDYDLWKIAGVPESGDAKKELPDTCYKEECDKCNGEGKTTCDDCNGDGKVRQAFQSHNRQVTAEQRRVLSDWCSAVGYVMPSGRRMRALGA